MTPEIFLVLVVLASIGVQLARRHRGRQRLKPVTDGPEDEPYRIFTTEYDWTGKAEDLASLLSTQHPDFEREWTDRAGDGWRAALALAAVRMPHDAVRQALIAETRLRLQPLGGSSVALSLLLDQSGSMKGEPMAATRVALDVAMDALAMPGLTTELLGYSTVGWQGGKPRQRWIEKGRPPRPGRLCALQHVIYKAGADDGWSEDSKRWMMHPDLLRENIDGEALRWAASRLRTSPAKIKALVVVSDGAPVDDATLLANGPRYLERDILRVIGEIENVGDIRLGAVGVGFAVARYYRLSAWSGIDGLTTTLLDHIATVLSRDSPAKS
ncbi:MAG TPA: hypothetical protein VGE65_01035 [Sphingobium sp.]